MSKRLKTQSKHYFDDEIHHIEISPEGTKIYHLHEWVHRTYNPYLLDYNRINHRNEYLDLQKRYEEAYRLIYGGEDFGNPEEVDDFKPKY